MGRVVHSSFLGGAQPVSASATLAPAKAHTYEGRQLYGEARALRLDEIPGVIEDYVRAARNAMAAGFDGVHIHAANGYLIDQFLRDGTNLRDDDYGGPVENRIRLLREVAQAVADEVGAGRTGVRLSPNGDAQGCNDSDPHSLFPAAAAALSDIGIAFLELREPGFEGTFGKAEVAPVHPLVRKAFHAPLVLNADYGLELGQAALDAGEADAIAYGRLFISNPDLVERFRTGAPLAGDVMATWYSQGPEGYVDYPALESAAA
jgi:2,4-dienoyl-CoA reductase-like NADH-dependent reductase (Old Yellow Enzyme family)